MLDTLLSYLSPETVLAIMADIEAVGDQEAIRQFWPELSAQLHALVGDDAEQMLAENGIDPYAGQE